MGLGKPRISVVMPSYNHARFVRTAIDSALNQSVKDIEVVVTDDASTDETIEKVREIRDPRVSVIALSENHGAAFAMNTSISRSQGEYVAILNSDDIFLEGKLERQLDYLERHREVGAIFGRPAFIDERGNALDASNTFYQETFSVINKRQEDWLREFFFRGNSLCHPSVLIRRDCYTAIGLYNAALAQLPDFDLWVRLLVKYPIHVIDEPVVGFRIMEGQKNASAPRPEVIVRLQYEWRKVLERYLHIPEFMIRKVFPEIPAVPTASPSVLSKWALRAINHLSGRAALEDKSVSTLTLDVPPTAWFVAHMAMRVPQPAHCLFALDTLYSCLADTRGDTRFREFITASGAHDVFGVLGGHQGSRAV
jgi:glycosyltransferase involved in cell wall biosynthesis